MQSGQALELERERRRAGKGWPLSWLRHARNYVPPPRTLVSILQDLADDLRAMSANSALDELQLRN